MRRTTILTAAVAMGGLLAASSQAMAVPSGYTFTTIVVPGSLGTIAGGINDRGQIVGDFTDDAGIQHGFLDTGGNFTSINPPGDTFTVLFGINNLGQILGTTSSIANFLYAHGTFTPLSNLGRSAFAFGINDFGQIVGGGPATATSASSTLAAASRPMPCRAPPIRRATASTTLDRLLAIIWTAPVSIPSSTGEAS